MKLEWRCLACTLAVFAVVGVSAQDCQIQIRPPTLDARGRDAHREREIYGWQLMTREERTAFLTRLDEARTAHERETLRALNQKAMNARARERGVVLRGPSSDAGDAGMPATACVDVAR
jgi:predicted Fe-S protein YdhL (DUF1289 family)